MVCVYNTVSFYVRCSVTNVNGVTFYRNPYSPATSATVHIIKQVRGRVNVFAAVNVDAIMRGNNYGNEYAKKRNI